MSDGCIFCGIVEGAVPCSLVAQDEHAIAFMDINPINAGHVLIIPRRHAVELTELSPDEVGNLVRLVHRVAGAVTGSGLRCEGYNLWQANGAVAGQTVFHAHFHVIPRYAGDNLRIGVDPARPSFDREALDAQAATIAAALAAP